jgi:acetyl-CoA carboxylase biotin carboxyl carrier protein
MKITEIQDLIKFVAKSGVSEVELETKEVKIVIRTNNGKVVSQMMMPSAMPQQQMMVAAPPTTESAATNAPAAAPAAPATSGKDESKYVTIKSPMIGTFYRSAGPDKPTFVNVGDEVNPGKTVCIIEAMKLFNEIECDVKGRIVKILVNDATPVEYDTPLFLVEPA